jgi:putative membrane protein
MGGGLFGMLFNVIIIIGLIYLVSKIFQRIGGNPRGNRPINAPLEILKRRYASGEIDDSTFKRLRNDLEE